MSRRKQKYPTAKKYSPTHEAADAGLKNVTQVARMLGTRFQDLDYHVKSGHVMRPTELVGKRLYYTPEQVEQIVKFWKERVPFAHSRFTQAEHDQMRAMRRAGWTLPQIAEQFGCVYQEVGRLLKGMRKPRPSSV